MIKNTLGFFIALSLSFNTYAQIIDLGNITRDTSSGLDWLDLTETVNLSYNDVTAKLSSGQELDGWRFATKDETELLWTNIGYTNALNRPILSSDSQYLTFVNAVNLLGNTMNLFDPAFDYGAIGITDNSIFVGGNELKLTVGLYHELTPFYVTPPNFRVNVSQEFAGVGSYLVRAAPVPNPSGIWLFTIGLIVIVFNKLGGNYNKAINTTN